MRILKFRGLQDSRGEGACGEFFYSCQIHLLVNPQVYQSHYFSRFSLSNAKGDIIN
jgi:hypothetical protein